MNILTWFLTSLPGLGLNEPVDLETWRNWFGKIAIVFGVIIIPISMIPTFPMFIADGKYILVALNSVLWLTLVGLLFWKAESYEVNAYLFIAVLYTIMVSYFIELGPFHARPAWLVVCAVIASLMFGTRGAILATVMNMVILLLLHRLVGPDNTAWAMEYRLPHLKWVVFVVNVSIITLGSCLPVGFLLDKLDQSLKHERDTQKELSAEKDRLKTVNRDLQNEIEQRKQTEKTLRESEERLKLLFEHAPDGYYLIDFEGKFLDGNRIAEQISGYRREELIGKQLIKAGLFLEEQVQKVSGFLTDNIQGMAGGPEELVLIKKDGSQVNVEMRTYPIKIENQNLILVIARDVTESKKIEEERKRLELQLNQVQKMEAIGTLAGGIAHDFNNILQSILVNTELSLYEYDGGHFQPGRLKEVLKSSERATDLVKQILTFSRQGEREMRPLQLSPVVKETLKLLRSTIPTTIEIRQHITTKQDYVLADPTEIHQVVMNLCANAAQSMRERGGVLELSLKDETVEDDTVAQSPDLFPGEYVRLTVKDTGDGMSAETMERIFDPFFTTKKRGEGTGMGLAVVHGIVRSYGGTIAVDSKVGEGSTFNIFFRKIERPSPKEVEPEKPLPIGKERILIVDDEVNIIDLLRDILENLGYEVTTRGSSMDALEAFRIHPDRYDLVITDQTMPHMTGRDLAMELLKIRSDIPIILCTGFSDIVSEEEAKAMGVREFVMKPIVMRDLADTVRKVLDET